MPEILPFETAWMGRAVEKEAKEKKSTSTENTLLVLKGEVGREWEKYMKGIRIILTLTNTE